MKLHELLAVETALENQADKTRTDLAATFEKKRHLFEEKRIVFQSSDEGTPASVESESSLQSTVAKELKWLSKHLAKSLDASYQVAETNTQARADVILEGETTALLLQVPATALLELEKRVQNVLQLFQAIPTLDPAKGFVADSEKGEGTYKAREVTKIRTKKDIKVITLAQPTVEHPAQAQMVNIDVPTGKIQELEWSGLITPAAKAELIDKVEILSRGIRRARARANEAQVDLSKRIGDKILEYVLSS